MSRGDRVEYFFLPCDRMTLVTPYPNCITFSESLYSKPVKAQNRGVESEVRHIAFWKTSLTDLRISAMLSLFRIMPFKHAAGQ